MKTLVSKINYELKKVFEANGYDKSYAYISVSGRPELADYQINSCFNIAKIQKKNPMEVADNIAALIKGLKIDGIDAFIVSESCKPGFVNLKLNDELLFLSMTDILNDDNLGINGKEILLDEAPKCILLDYGGANVAKPLHVGHLRVAVIGEALKRLYQRLGIKTISDVHLGDFGLQMGLVIEELKDKGVLLEERLYEKPLRGCAAARSDPVSAFQAFFSLRRCLLPIDSVHRRSDPRSFLRSSSFCHTAYSSPACRRSACRWECRNNHKVQ